MQHLCFKYDTVKWVSNSLNRVMSFSFFDALNFLTYEYLNNWTNFFPLTFVESLLMSMLTFKLQRNKTFVYWWQTIHYAILKLDLFSPHFVKFIIERITRVSLTVDALLLKKVKMGWGQMKIQENMSRSWLPKYVSINDCIVYIVLSVGITRKHYLHNVLSEKTLNECS